MYIQVYIGFSGFSMSFLRKGMDLFFNMDSDRFGLMENSIIKADKYMVNPINRTYNHDRIGARKTGKKRGAR